jgi:hypothetical protein
MDLVRGLLAALGAGVAGFFGHLLAHDFVEVTPRLGRAIIQFSTRTLRETDRARYTEEWLADLDERSGVFAKLAHALGCFLCVRRIRKQSLKNSERNIVVRFQAGGPWVD